MTGSWIDDRLPVAAGQEWAHRHGGGYTLIRIVEVLDGRHLHPPAVTLVPAEFALATRWWDGGWQADTYPLCTPGHRLGGPDYALYRRTDGTLTALGEHEERQHALHVELAELERRRAEIASQLSRWRW